MSWSVSDLGTASIGTSSPVVLSGLSVPANVLVVVAVTQLFSTASTFGTVTDSNSDNFSLITTVGFNGSTTQQCGLYYLGTTTSPITSITYTQGTNGDTAGIAALYATINGTGGVLDTNVTASAFGSGSSPSVTSGTSAQSGEFFVGFIGFNVATSSGFSQDVAHGWTSTGGFDNIPESTHNFGQGGNQTNAARSSLIYSPTLSVSAGWGALVAGFSPGSSSFGIVGGFVGNEFPGIIINSGLIVH